MDAPDDLWSRIADEIGEQAPPPGPELAKVMSMDDRPRRRRIAAVAPWVMTAAAAAVIGFVAIGIADRADAPNEPLSSAVEVALADRDSVTTTLVSEASEATAKAVIDQDGHGFVLARDLPELPENQTYQLWGVVEGGEVISLGIFGPNPEVETFTVESPVTALALTIEEYSRGHQQRQPRRRLRRRLLSARRPTLGHAQAMSERTAYGYVRSSRGCPRWDERRDRIRVRSLIGRRRVGLRVVA